MYFHLAAQQPSFPAQRPVAATLICALLFSLSRVCVALQPNQRRNPLCVFSEWILIFRLLSRSVCCFPSSACSHYRPTPAASTPRSLHSHWEARFANRLDSLIHTLHKMKILQFAHATLFSIKPAKSFLRDARHKTNKKIASPQERISPQCDSVSLLYSTFSFVCSQKRAD